LHFLSNLVEPVLPYDTELHEWMRQDMGGLPIVPEEGNPQAGVQKDEPSTPNPPF
jgi:hypothetical protein